MGRRLEIFRCRRNILAGKEIFCLTTVVGDWREEVRKRMSTWLSSQPERHCGSFK